MPRLLFLIQLICFQFLASPIFSQEIKSPSEFLGYSLGTKFTYHYKIIDYCKELSLKSKSVQLFNYGETSEGRELIALAFSSPHNIERLEEIRISNLQRAGFLAGEPTIDIPIVWLGYNVHGNEASGSEVALKVLYELVTSVKNATEFSQIFENIVVIIDPCMNPDGRDRYVASYNQKQGHFINSSPNDWTHIENWPSGRYNHYIFDLNRDWAWLTQKETQERTKFYRSWMPEVYVDFHEMMPQYSYFFGPPAEPINTAITDWQREYQRIASKEYVKVFKERNWNYFTEEVFDLLYPSYGDSWTCLNGAVGFTFEQGGHGVAGLSLKRTKRSEELTLNDRIEKHFETTLMTLITASRYKDQLLKEYKNYFDYKKNKNDVTYIVRIAKDKSRVNTLLRLLQKHQIEFSQSINSFEVEGYRYSSKRTDKYSINKGDIILTNNQTMGRALDVLFSPEVIYNDSLTYDLTSWALPYAYNLDVIKTTKKLTVVTKKYKLDNTNTNAATDTSVYVIPWSSLNQVKFISRLMNENINLGYLKSDTTLNGEQFDQGSIIISEVSLLSSSKASLFSLLRDKFQAEVKIQNSMQLLECSEFISPLNITVVAGEETNATDFGGIWFYFDQVIGYPINIIQSNRLSVSKLEKSDVVIVGDGTYGNSTKNIIYNYVKGGGKAILFENAINIFAENKASELYALKEGENIFNTKDKNTSKLRTSLTNKAVGAIIKVELDKQNNISNGGMEYYYSLKQNSITLPKMKNTLAYIPDSPLMSGFIGGTLIKDLPGKSMIAAENIGNGEVIYFVESPVFRGFWNSGMQIFSNSIFFSTK
ncbi:M14 family zinc carboxypeptidase [Flammeovirga kamogawensis]|uniref:Peptidase M14 domain-containing protein n=1 Tax=Flammeovirga kamogawensis TaxID=373891 RepID=A0ABX8GRH9_9BACT|nr:M14 family zinc carboxypeptidase [Flammeovirga kamogawensis]MBB6464031.1 hypothetical protein [Flammeovirga kamogawensis]QWG06136.1 hypothetical protein KM029_12370 [Flammeovirga kamogawensis]TRX67968.1 hypothetical protein EO216_07395 [Flammeovirga kamogawensis]